MPGVHLRTKSTLRKEGAATETLERVCSDLPLTSQRELNAFYLTKFALGPAVTVVLILFPLLIAYSGREYVSGNPESVEFRRYSKSGGLCGSYSLSNSSDQAGGVGGAEDAPGCTVFPRNPLLPVLDMHYVSFTAYVMSLLMAGAGISILVFSPVYSSSRIGYHLLTKGLVVWPVLLLAAFFGGKAEWLGWTSLVGTAGGIVLLYCVRGVLDGYMPAFVDSHPDVVGVELATYPNVPRSIRSMPMTLDSDSSCRTVGSTGYPRVDRSGAGSDVVSIVFSMVTPRDFSRPFSRPVNVPKLDLTSIHKQTAAQYPTKPSNFDPMPTERALEIEAGGAVDAECDPGRVREVAGMLVRNATSTQALGQGISFGIQFLVVFFVTSSSSVIDVMGLKYAALVGILWVWVFGIWGLRGIRTRKSLKSHHGSWIDRIVLRLRKFITIVRSTQTQFPQLFKLEMGRMMAMMAINSFKTMGALYLIDEFGLGPTKIFWLLLVYAVIAPIAHLIGYISSSLVKSTQAKIRLLEIYLLILLGCPVVFAFGLKKHPSLYLATALCSLVIAGTPTIIGAVQSELVPSEYMMKIVIQDGILEASTWWVGPLLVGLILDFTGSLKLGLISTAIFTLISMFLVGSIKVEEGAKQRRDVDILGKF